MRVYAFCKQQTTHVPDIGPDSADATSSGEAVPDFAAGLQCLDHFGSSPLAGRRIGVIRDGSSGAGVDPAVTQAVADAAAHLESLGAELHEVTQHTCSHTGGQKFESH